MYSDLGSLDLGMQQRRITSVLPGVQIHLAAGQRWTLGAPDLIDGIFFKSNHVTPRIVQGCLDRPAEDQPFVLKIWRVEFKN